MPFRVLSIDGGGIRGIIPAVVLGRLETLTGRPIHDLFDLIVGTSTGGLLTLGLTAPDAAGQARFTAADLVRLYLDEGETIFSRPLAHRIRSANGLANAKYPAAGIEDVLERYFGDLRLAQLLGDVVVTAYETELREPWFFRSRRARADDGYDFRIRDVGRAAAAAPTFFPASRVRAGDGRAWTLVDGGVYANNPAMVGIVEAMAAYEADDVLTLSLGTGDLTRPLPYRRIRGWGLVQWARPLIDVVFDGASKTTDFQAQQLSRSTGEVERHTRFQVELTTGNDDLDDVSPANLAALLDLAETLLTDRREELEQLAASLVSPTGRAVDPD